MIKCYEKNNQTPTTALTEIVFSNTSLKKYKGQSCDFEWNYDVSFNQAQFTTFTTNENDLVKKYEIVSNL